MANRITAAMANSSTQIDPEVFFREFLSTDPKYGAVAQVLDRLRREMRLLLGWESLSLGRFIDLTSIEYDANGELIPKDEEMLKVLAKAMQLVDVDRTALKLAATSGLTREQVAAGPTSIKIPVALLCSEISFRRFTRGLSSEYHECPDFPSLISTVHAARVHQKPVFLLFGNEDTINAYYSPAWSMQEMQERILMKGNEVALHIYNSKATLNRFCRLVGDTPGGHMKILYLGKKKTARPS